MIRALAFALLAFPAHAQTNCAPHPDVTAGLARNYAETVVAMGLSANGDMIEVFAAPSGTWTIIITSPAGLSCMAASGAAFEQATTPAGIDG